MLASRAWWCVVCPIPGALAGPRGLTVATRALLAESRHMEGNRARQATGRMRVAIAEVHRGARAPGATLRAGIPGRAGGEFHAVMIGHVLVYVKHYSGPHR